MVLLVTVQMAQPMTPVIPVSLTTAVVVKSSGRQLSLCPCSAMWGSQGCGHSGWTSQQCSLEVSIRADNIHLYYNIEILCVHNVVKFSFGKMFW